MDCCATPPATNGQRCYILVCTDLLVAVCKYITPASIAHVACTCRTLRSMASADEIWKQHCPQEWRELGVCPLPEPACASYLNWRSIGIAAYTMPTIPTEYSDAQVCRTAAALVTQGLFAQADLLLCKRCFSSEDGSVWMELSVLLMYVIKDARRGRRALMLAVQLTSPLVSSADYAAEWDTRCRGSSETMNCHSQGQCQALVRCFLLSLASRALNLGDVEQDIAGCHTLQDGSEAADIDKVRKKMHAVAISHNDNARLECRKRAAWLLSRKVAEERRSEPEQQSSPQEAPERQGERPSPSIASSSSSSDEGESSDDETEEEMEEMEKGSTYVAAACARTSHLRACAESVAVEWMRCGCDLAQHAVTEDQDASGTMPPGHGGHADVAHSPQPSNQQEDQRLCLHKALMNLADVLAMVDREEEAAHAYTEAARVASSLGDVSLAVHTLLKAAGLAASADTDPASRLKGLALDLSKRALILVHKALAPVLRLEEGMLQHGEGREVGEDREVDGEGAESIGKRLVEHMKNRLLTILRDGLDGDALQAAGAIRAIGGTASSRELVHDLLEGAQKALQIKIRVLQARGLFEARAGGTRGRSSDGQADGIGDESRRFSQFGYLDAMTDGDEQPELRARRAGEDGASAHRKEAEGRRVDDGVSVTASGEELIHALKCRSLLLDAIDLLRCAQGELADRVAEAPGAQALDQAVAQVAARASTWQARDVRTHCAKEMLCMTLMDASRYGEALRYLNLLLPSCLSRVSEGRDAGSMPAEDRKCLYRTWEALGLCLLNTYQHKLAARAFDVCLFVCRESDARIHDLLLAFLSSPWHPAGGEACAADSQLCICCDARWSSLAPLVGAQDASHLKDDEGSGKLGLCRVKLSLEHAQRDDAKWVEEMALSGLEAEALGHKGHAMYRQRHLIRPASRMLARAVRMASEVLTCIADALSPESTAREQDGDVSQGLPDGNEEAVMASFVGNGRANLDAAETRDGGLAQADAAEEWREQAATVWRDVSATRVIALGTLGDVLLALGSVLQARAVYGSCKVLVQGRAEARSKHSTLACGAQVQQDSRLCASASSREDEEDGGMLGGEAPDEDVKLFNQSIGGLKLPHDLLPSSLPCDMPEADDTGEDESLMDGRCIAALQACLGDTHVRFEEWDAVLACGQRARASAQQLQHARIMCKGSYLIGYGKMMLGLLEEAEHWLQTCHAECLQGNFHNSRAYLLLAMGELALFRHESAVRASEEAQGQHGDQGNAQGGWADGRCQAVDDVSGEPQSITLRQSGQKLLEAGLKLAREVEDAPCECLALLRLASFHSSYGDTGEAGRERAGARVCDGEGCASRGEFMAEGEEDLGLLDQAPRDEKWREICDSLDGKGGELLLRSLKLARELQDVVGQSNVLEAMGKHLARRGRVDAANSAWGKCLAMREEVEFAKGAHRIRGLLGRSRADLQVHLRVGGCK